MKLETERLILKQISTKDVFNIHALHKLPETNRFNTLGIPESIETTKKIVNDWLIEQNAKPQSSYIFCLKPRDSDQFIGLIALKMGKTGYKSAEVWFKIHVDYWNKGLTSEALTKLLDFGFKHLLLHRIEAGCAVENIASIKVLEKVGFIKEGMKRQNLPIRGEWKDSFFYAILKDKFKEEK